MIPENLQDKFYELLGVPPWDEKILKQCYFDSFTETRKFIQSHPGYSIYSELNSIRLSLDIFLNAVTDLIASINQFKGELNKPSFWNRPNRQFAEELDLSIQRGIASSVMCAMALVDHARRFDKHYSIPGYQDKVTQYFINSPDHIFLKDFRNYSIHAKITKTNWNRTHNSEGEKTSFLVYKDELLEFKDWKSTSRQYIEDRPQGINIEQLFTDYSKQVLEFHNWMRSAVLESYSESISSYIHYQRFIDGLSIKSYWALLLSQFAIPKHLDPYLYLDKYLTKLEIEKVLSLPHRSQEQVDYIIDIVDEYDVCDNHLQDLVYECFGVQKISSVATGIRDRPEATTLVIKQLTCKLGHLTPALTAQVSNLPVEELASLGEALLDFQSIADLEGWFEQNR